MCMCLLDAHCLKELVEVTLGIQCHCFLLGQGYIVKLCRCQFPEFLRRRTVKWILVWFPLVSCVFFGFLWFPVVSCGFLCLALIFYLGFFSGCAAPPAQPPALGAVCDRVVDGEAGSGFARPQPACRATRLRAPSVQMAVGQK